MDTANCLTRRAIKKLWIATWFAKLMPFKKSLNPAKARGQTRWQQICLYAELQRRRKPAFLNVLLDRQTGQSWLTANPLNLLKN